jgi:serine/threonine protein kinase
MKGYTNLEKIAEGNMGTIYRARQVSLNRLVAIKKLHAHLSREATFRERFKREAEIVAKLDHPNIIHIYDYGIEDESCYIVMEYCDGPNLEELLKEKLLPEVALLIIREVAEALLYAHTERIVHRDIKPSNILINKKGSVKLTDFGIAQMRHLPSLTHPASVVGTPYYMSPEQVEGKKVDPRSDLFSLGVVLYQASTGCLPFEGESVISIMSKISAANYTPPREKNKTISKEVSAIIEKCLAGDVKERYQTAAEVIEETEQYLKKLGLANIKNELGLFLSDREKYEQNLKRKIIHLHLEEGKTFIARGEVNKAYAKFQRILELEPENREVIAYLDESKPGTTEVLAPLKRKINFKRLTFASLLTALIGWGIIIIGQKLFFNAFPPEPQGEVLLIPERQKEITQKQENKLVVENQPQKTKRKAKENKQRKPPALVNEKASAKEYGSLKIICQPLATIFINGEEKGKTLPVRAIKLEPGKHILELRSEIAAEVRKEIVIKAGEELVLEIKMPLLPAYLQIECPAQTKIYLDGVFLRETRQEREKLEVPPGRHILKCVSKEHITWEKEFYFERGKVTTIKVELSKNE